MSITKTDKQALRHVAQEVVDESGEGWFHADEFSDTDVPYTDAEFIAVAKPSAVLALLDELEAAGRRNAELEASHAQVIHARDHYKRVASEGIQSLAGARTLTVKLPPACADDEYFVDGVFQPLRYERDVERAILAAGIALDTGE